MRLTGALLSRQALHLSTHGQRVTNYLLSVLDHQEAGSELLRSIEALKASFPNAISRMEEEASLREEGQERLAYEEQLKKELCEYLGRFDLKLQISENMDFSLGFYLQCDKGWNSVEFSLLTCLIELASTERIHRLKKCSVCARWMLARQIGQEFCSKPCRQHASRMKSEIRELRNAYRRVSDVKRSSPSTTIRIPDECS